MDSQKQIGRTDGGIIPEECPVALLCGGTSSERDISLSSGAAAAQALTKAGFPVTMLDPATKEDLGKLLGGGFSVAFLCMHGKGGEDGTLQGFLETIGLPYTGSGVWASALAMDKTKTKVFYREAGIPTPASRWLRRGQAVDVPGLVAELGSHLVVKAASGGSTLGLYIVEDAKGLQEALEKAFALDDDVLVEQFVAGVEYTVSVVGNDEPMALPIIQILPANDFYDFESKYAPGGSRHICPAPLSEDQTAIMQSIAVSAHRALGCRGVSRTDFIMGDSGAMWALETNTLPGMTATSLLPDAAGVMGVGFPELCTRLVELALEKRPAVALS